MEQYPEHAITAIRQGFVIGNHSYDYPHFSSLLLEQCLEQICRTYKILDTIYARAGVPRPVKVFRFPYGDKGALTGYDVFATPGAKGAARKAAIQQCLRERGYRLPDFPGIRYDYWRQATAGDVDWFWTYDVLEWSIYAAQPQFGVTSIEHVYTRMEEEAPLAGRGLNTPGSDEVILLHDQPETTALFAPIIDRLLAKGVRFVAPEW